MIDSNLFVKLLMIAFLLVIFGGPIIHIAIDYTEPSQMLELRNWVKDAAQALGVSARSSGAGVANRLAHRSGFPFSAFVVLEHKNPRAGT